MASVIIVNDHPASPMQWHLSEFVDKHLLLSFIGLRLQTFCLSIHLVSDSGICHLRLCHTHISFSHQSVIFCQKVESTNIDFLDAVASVIFLSGYIVFYHSI